jgi:hydrogenase expression/formation protein HypC
MCIGIPMQVLDAEPGFANCFGRGETRRISTLLVGDCVAGEWLLVFLNDARERIDAARAAEVNATLDILQQVLDGGEGSGDPGFILPSSAGVSTFAHLSGAGHAAPAANEQSEKEILS